MKKVLTIAGSDSGGGAGIQADLKTFAACGTYGMSAITALTAQNTMGVTGVWEVPASFVQEQIDAVMSDIGADAWKTGMLSNADIIEVVAERAKYYKVKRLVVDPVMVAKGGDLLLQPSASEALIHRLLPLAYVVTPNHHEAEVLTGLSIQTLEDMKKAARALHSMGPRFVVVKGGHLPEASDAIDILFDGKVILEVRQARIATPNTHGTGCTFASALAAELAKNVPIREAIQCVKTYVTEAIRGADALEVGSGHGPLDHFWNGSGRDALGVEKA